MAGTYRDIRNLESSNKDVIGSGQFAGVFPRDYSGTWKDGSAGTQPQSKTIPDELKKRVESAAKEFNFTIEDICRVEKALDDQNPKRNSGKVTKLVQDDVKIRVAAAINKYKFTSEEIATVQKAIHDQKSMKPRYASGFRGGGFNCDRYANRNYLSRPSDGFDVLTGVGDEDCIDICTIL